MTSEDLRQEIDREPFVPLRLRLASGSKVDIRQPHTAWLRQNTLLLVHPLRAGTHAIGDYEVIALRLIEKIETLGTPPAAGRGRRSAS